MLCLAKNSKGENMNLVSVMKNPVILAIGEALLEPVVSLVKSLVIPKVKRLAFEKLSEGLQEFGEFILDQKVKVESTETTVDDEAYALSREAFKAFLDQANSLYEKM